MVLLFFLLFHVKVVKNQNKSEYFTAVNLSEASVYVVCANPLLIACRAEDKHSMVVQNADDV